MKNFFLICFIVIFATLIIPLSLGGYYIKIISPENNSAQGNPVRVYGTWEYWRGTAITTEMINQRNIEIDWGDGNIDTAININRTRVLDTFAKGTFDTEPIIGCDNTGEVTSDCNLGSFSHVYSECGEFTIKITMYPLLYQDYSKSINVYVCDTPSYCGDGIINQDWEQCEGTDLNGETCSSLIPNSIGAISCNSDCSFNLSNCILPESNLYWADSDKNPISRIDNVKLGETEVFIVFNNPALNVGEIVTFQIYRENGTNTYPIRVGLDSISATVSSSGAIVTDWTPTIQDIINANGTDNFYFNVIYLGIIEKSNFLKIFLFENPPTWEDGIEIGKCLKNEVMEGECVNEDSIITISQEATWNWGEKNTFSNEEDCKAFVQSVGGNEEKCVGDGGSWHYDPKNEFSKCVDISYDLKCLDIIKLPFFEIKEFLITFLIIFGVYAFLIKEKCIKQAENFKN